MMAPTESPSTTRIVMVMRFFLNRSVPLRDGFVVSLQTRLRRHGRQRVSVPNEVLLLDPVRTVLRLTGPSPGILRARMWRRTPETVPGHSAFVGHTC